jgi:hypothetical protein
MPYFFAKTLQVHIDQELREELQLIKMLGQDPALRYLMIYVLPENSADKTLSGILRFWGWTYLRRALTNSYIFYSYYKQWPRLKKNVIGIGIEDFETQLDPHMILSAGRHTLLYLYLKLVENRYTQNGSQIQLSLSQNALDVAKSLIKKRNRRTNRIDLLVLLLWHMGEYFSLEEMEGHLNSGLSFREIFEKMSKHYQNVLITNISNYCLSVYDDTFFLDDPLI